jgi:hypothetical protein
VAINANFLWRLFILHVRLAQSKFDNKADL